MAEEKQKSSWGGPGRGGGRRPRDPKVGVLVAVSGSVTPQDLRRIDAEVRAGRALSRAEFLGRLVREWFAKEGAKP